MTTRIDADALRKELSGNWFKLAAIALSLTLLTGVVYLANPQLPDLKFIDFLHMAISVLQLGLNAVTWLTTNHVLYAVCLALLVLSKFIAAQACTALLPLGNFDNNQKENALRGIAIAKKAQTLSDYLILAILLQGLAVFIFSAGLSQPVLELVKFILFACAMVLAIVLPTPLVQPTFLKVKNDENTEFWQHLRNAHWARYGAGATVFSDIGFISCLAFLTKHRLGELND